MLIISFFEVASNAEAETATSLANAEASATIAVANQSSRETRKIKTAIGTTCLSAGLAFGAAVAGAPVVVAAGGAMAIGKGISYAVNTTDEATTDYVHSGMWPSNKMSGMMISTCSLELVQHTLSELEGAVKFGTIVSGVNVRTTLILATILSSNYPLSSL